MQLSGSSLRMASCVHFVAGGQFKLTWTPRIHEIGALNLPKTPKAIVLSTLEVQTFFLKAIEWSVER